MSLGLWALLLFVLVAASGSLMAVRLLSGGALHWLVRKGHRFTAVFALAVLAVAASRGLNTPVSWYAFGILSLTFLAGLICFAVWLRGEKTPPMLIFGHASLGLTGLAVLAVATFGV